MLLFEKKHLNRLSWFTTIYTMGFTTIYTMGFTTLTTVDEVTSFCHMTLVIAFRVTNPALGIFGHRRSRDFLKDFVRGGANQGL